MRESSIVNNSVTLNAVGDVWFGDHPVCIGHGVNSIARRRGPDFLFDGIRKLFAEGDFNFCNLESVLSETGIRRWWLPSVEMRGFPACVDGLASAGINVVNVANNHILQHGMLAFHETIELLASGGIDVVGVDVERKSRVFRCTRNGIDFAFAGYSMHPEEYYSGDNIAYSFRDDVQRIVEEVRDLRAGFDGFIVCSMHWGHEFIHYPTPEQVDFAHRLIDAGVNVLLGHHPHVLQGCEEYNGGLICYSLGNFIFDLWPPATRKTVMLRMVVKPGNNFNYSFVPLVINEDYQPIVADGDIKAKIEADLLVYNREITVQGEAFVAANSSEYRQQLAREFRYSQYKYFLRHLHKYPVNMLLQSIFRTVGRRLMLH